MTTFHNAEQFVEFLEKWNISVEFGIQIKMERLTMYVLQDYTIKWVIKYTSKEQ